MSVRKLVANTSKVLGRSHSKDKDFEVVEESDLTDAEKRDLQLFGSFVEELTKSKYANATPKVRERLASAMLRRRKHFVSLQRRRSKKEKGNGKAPATLPAPAVEQTQGVEPLKQDAVFCGQSPIRATSYSYTATLDTSVYTSSTWWGRETAGGWFLAASEDQQELETRDETIDYPPRPQGKKPNCPFCYLQLSEKDVETPKNWISHIHMDLYPYICLLEDCTTPNRLYRRRKEWLNHIVKEEESLRHTEKLSCRLCGAFGSLERLGPHVETHLISLALLSLPWTDYLVAPPDLASSASSAESVCSSSSRSLPSIPSLDVKDGNEEPRLSETDMESAHGLPYLPPDGEQTHSEASRPHEKELIQKWIESLAWEL